MDRLQRAVSVEWCEQKPDYTEWEGKKNIDG